MCEVDLESKFPAMIHFFPAISLPGGYRIRVLRAC